MHFNAVAVVIKPTNELLRRVRREGYKITMERANVASITAKRIPGEGYPQYQIPSNLPDGFDVSIVAWEEHVANDDDDGYYQVVVSLSGHKLVPTAVQDCEDAESTSSARFMVSNGVIVAQAFPSGRRVHIIELRVHKVGQTTLRVFTDSSQWTEFDDLGKLPGKHRPAASAAIRKTLRGLSEATHTAPSLKARCWHEGRQEMHRKIERGSKHHPHKRRRK